MAWPNTFGDVAQLADVCGRVTHVCHARVHPSLPGVGIASVCGSEPHRAQPVHGKSMACAEFVTLMFECAG